MGKECRVVRIVWGPMGEGVGRRGVGVVEVVRFADGYVDKREEGGEDVVVVNERVR